MVRQLMHKKKSGWLECVNEGHMGSDMRGFFFKCIWWIDTEPYVSCFVCTQISTPEHTQSFIHLDAPEQWVHNLPRNAYIPIRARPCFAHAPLRKQLLHNVFKVAPGMWRSIPGGSGVSHSLKSNTHTGFFMQAHNGKSSTEGARRKPQPRLMTFWDCIELNCPFKRVTLLMRSSITTGGEEKTSSWKVDQTVVMEAP